MDMAEMLYEINKPLIYMDTLERFHYNWFFEIPTHGSIIYKNKLFFNDTFISRYGDDILVRFLENMEIFVYDQTNTENFQQILTIEDLQKFNETNNYHSYRYIVGKNTILICCRFMVMLEYKKTLNMDM